MNFTNKYLKNLKNGPRNVLLMVGLFALSLVVLTRLTEHTRTTQRMSYSEFLKNVENNSIKSVRIVGQEASGIFQNGRKFEAIIADNPKNWDILREHNIEFSVATPSPQFTFWHFIMVLSLGAIIFAGWFLVRQSRGGSNSSNIFSMGKSKAKMYLPSQIKVNFDSVAGAEEAKEELQDIVNFLKNPDRYRRLGAKLTRGVLLVGEPGNGKTLLAKAVAGEANCPFFSITGSDFIEVFVGVGAARIRDLFAQARKHAPAIIFIDEIDAIGRQRGSGLGGGHDEREQTLNQLLTEMDGFDSSGVPVVILAATNIPDVLDKALLRPGRFDRRINVPFPDTKARENILRIHARSIKVSPDVDFNKIAQDTAGFSGSDLGNLVNQAALIASKKGHDTVTTEVFDEAFKKLVQSPDSNGGGTMNIATRSNSRAKLYMPSQVKVNFNSVAGAHEAKEELQDVIDFLKNPAKYKQLGAKLTRGVLLVGEPGNGKTLLAKAVAGEANCPFFSVSGSEFIEVYVGVGAARVRDLFAQARKHAPSIIFIDEIDAIGRQRGNSPYGNNDERDQTLNQLLTEMDGFDSSHSSVIVIAATNRLDVLDKALLRPGRFDRKVDVPYPDLISREAILKVHASTIKLSPDIDLSKVARGTTGFSGADLANLINEAAINAAKHNQEIVMIHDIEEARDKIILGKERKTMVMTQDELKMTAFHEAGHALITLMMPDVTHPLYKITIIPRGDALGVTHSLPERDAYSQTKDQLLAAIKMALGGRIAEELVFNKISTGAGSDFVKATDIARRMVCHYGMSEALGTVIYQQNNKDYEYSQETARKIDDEIRSIIDRCYQEATKIIKDNREKLDLLAQKLLEKETLFAAEIYEILGITPRADHAIR